MADRTDRRSVLAGGATLCGLALAGCLGDDGGDASDEPDNETDGDGDPVGNADDAENGTDDADDEHGNGDDAVDEWPMFQFDAGHAGAHDGEAPTDGVEEDWQTDLDAAALCAPVIAEDTLVVHDEDGGVYALDPDDGEELWSTEVPADVEGFVFLPDLVPAINDGAVHVPATDGMYGLDVDSGDELWHFPTDQRPPQPTVFDDRVAFTDRQNKVYVLESATGDTVWDHWDQEDRRSFYYTPMVTDDHVVALFNEQLQMLARNDDGGLEGKVDVYLEEDHNLQAAVTNAGSMWYLPTSRGTVIAGEIDDDLEFVEHWREDVDADFRDDLNVSANEEYVAVVGNNQLFVLDADDGSLLWSADEQLSDDKIPVLVGDALFIADNVQNIYAYELATGDEHWNRIEGAEWSTGHRISSAAGALYLGGRDGSVTALIQQG